MAEYPDLTPYDYFPVEARSERNLVNIGWLGVDRPFSTGIVPRAVVDRLVTLAAELRHATRGFHICPFCQIDPPEVTPPGTSLPLPLGMAEIHVRGRNGVVYAAPTLVIHYITDHGYLPPQEFLTAVLATVPAQDVG